MTRAWNGSPLRNHRTDFRMYKSSSLYFLETSFLLIYDKDRLDKVDLGRVGLLFVDLFWLKTFIQKLVI